MTNSQAISHDVKHSQMVQAYITAMCWASVDEEGNPFDSSYDLSQQALDAACIACTRFLDVHGKDLELVLSTSPEYNYEQAGHDLFLNREGHGAGFWDRGLGHFGEVFSKYCDSIGRAEPYIGDDQLIYMAE